MENDINTGFTGIIPARYASTRFPGKPLVMIGNKSMIRRVYEQASLALSRVFVATDDQRIFDEVIDFGGNAVMTSAKHRSGTDRCAEAAELTGNAGPGESDVIINIQGDEPFIKPGQIELLKNCFNDSEVEIATLVRKTAPDEDIFNPNHPKVILDSNGFAIYFSRAAIPHIRDVDPSRWNAVHSYYKHIGLYAYRRRTLKLITDAPRGILEEAESLEQNRWIEAGYRIKTALTEWESMGIDTPADLEKALLMLNKLL